jgi:hypothetical protein
MTESGSLEEDSGLSWTVLARFGIEAGLCQAQAFDRLSADDVRVHNLVDVGFRDVSVPDGFRIYHDGGTVFALVETASLIGAHSSLQAQRSQFFLKCFLQPGLSGWIAGASGIAHGALVSTDEDVLVKFRHRINIILSHSRLRDGRWRKFIHQQGHEGSRRKAANSTVIAPHFPFSGSGPV